MSETLEYKPLELYDAGGKIETNWYFKFYFRHPLTLEMVRMKPTFDINRLHTKVDRYAYAKKIIKKINEGLRSGEINPFKLPLYNTVNDAILSDVLVQAHRLHTKSKTSETKKSYKTHLNRFVEFIEFNNLDGKRPIEFTVNTAEDFQLYLQEEREIINATINNNIGLVRQYFDYMRKKRLISANPFLDVTPLPMRRSFKYVPYNEEEKSMISAHLKKESPLLYLFSQILYTCFCRPKEICALTRSDIDFKTGHIVVRHSAIKNERTSFRQMFTPLTNLLQEMNFDRLPMKTVLFKDICGDSPRLEVRRRKITDLWSKLVQQDLEINNQIYALKHTGNCDYIMLNPSYDILWLQQQNGHATLEQTQTYIRDLPIRKLAESNIQVRLFGQ